MVPHSSELMLGKKVGKSSIPQIIPHTIYEDSTGIIARTI